MTVFRASALFTRYFWLITLLAGIAISSVMYLSLIKRQQQILQIEVNHRSMLKFTNIQSLLLQHMDAAMVLPAFMDAAMASHKYINKAEARYFLRHILLIHPKELQAIALFPAVGHGDVVRSGQQQQSLTMLNPPVDMEKLKYILPNKEKITFVQDAAGKYKLRILLTSHEKPRGHAVADLNIKQLLSTGLSHSQVAGLDVDIIVSIAGRETLLVHHQSRSRAEDNSQDDHEKLYWQDQFNIGTQSFIVRTQAAPALIHEFNPWYPRLVFLLPLFIAILLSLIIYRRSLHQQQLEKAVKTRTSELADEKKKLTSIIDNAKESILLMDVQGNILQANPAACTLFGYATEEWKQVQVQVHDLVPQVFRRNHAQWFDQESTNQQHHIMDKTRELQGRRRDGSVFPCEITVNTFKIQRQRQFSIILRDMTEYKQREWIRDALLKTRAYTQMQLPLQVRLKSILKALQYNAWPFTATSAAIFTMQGNELWLAASLGWRRDDKKQWLMLPYNKCLCGNAIGSCEHCQPAVSPDSPNNGKAIHRHDDKPVKLCMPIIHGDQQLGLLHIHTGALTLSKQWCDFYHQVRAIVTELLWGEHTHKLLESSEEKHRLLVESLPIGIIILVKETVRFANPSMTTLLSFEHTDTLLGKNILNYIDTASQAQFVRHLLHHQQAKSLAYSQEIQIKSAKGTLWVEAHPTAIMYEGGPAIQIQFQDISARKAAEEKLTWLSYYDALTSLPNRRLFADRIKQAIALAKRERRHIALFYMDLDRFKFINDTLGHAAGDLVLKETAMRLQQLLRTSDTAARMGGDEFVVLLPEISANTAMFVAHKIRAAITEQSYRLGKQQFTLDVSIGIAIFPKDGEDGETLLKHADMAMYHAKQQQLHTHHFSKSMEQRISRRLQMEQALTQAISNKQLQLYYQSQICNGSIIGVESLIRWQHPDLGLVSPAEFIPLAEESNLIHAITYWVLTEAGQQAVIWEQAGIRPARISVNISAVQLIQKGLAEKIIKHIEETGARPEWMEIELTESAIMRDPENAIIVMQKLVDAGISIAIDDFGTGYSSLAYLKQLPAEWLKIDISFVRNLPDNKEDASIVRSIIAMADALGMKTIAEGVETKLQFEFLQREGCPAMQGYLFSKPLPSDKASLFLRNFSTER